MRLLFDLETDGFLDVVTKIHCMSVYDLDTNEQTDYALDGILDYAPLSEGLELLENASELYGHNIIKYDMPVLRKLHPELNLTDKQYDTLNMSRLIYPEIIKYDYGHWKHMNKFYAGKHSLAAWGERLRFAKGDFGKETDWQEWSLPMSKYCSQDVLLNVKLLRFFEEREYSQTAIDLEMEFQKIIFQQEQNGIHFDIEKARELKAELDAEKAELTAELKSIVPPKIFKSQFIPKVNNKTRGYVKGVPVEKVVKKEFNPGSRMQIIEYLKDKYDWVPTVFTDKKNPKLDADVFNDLPYPEAPIFAKYFDVDKILGRLYNGPKSWLKNYKDGKCWGWMTTNGAVTGRCTHKIIANVPKVGSFKGKECRSLFVAPKGFKMVGCDAGRLELVCLAHYLAAYDGGEYAREVESGDIHTKNQHAAGLPTRDNAKTFIYALLYGGGDEKIGSIVVPDVGSDGKRAAGRHLKSKFFAEIPAYKQLTADIKRAIQDRGYLKGLDGRILKIRSAHSALNMLLQNAGAVIMKKANVILWQKLDVHGYPLINDEVKQILQYHDEYEVVCREGLEDLCSKLMTESITEAAEFFNLRCRLDAEAKVGDNWYDVH